MFKQILLFVFQVCDSVRVTAVKQMGISIVT